MDATDSDCVGAFAGIEGADEVSEPEPPQPAIAMQHSGMSKIKRIRKMRISYLI